MVDFNIEFEKFIEMKGSELMGNRLSEVMKANRGNKFDWITLYKDIVQQGNEKEIEQYSTEMESWYRIIAYCTDNEYIITHFINVSKEMCRLAELDNFFNVHLELLCIADLEGNFLRVNKAWEDTLGYSTEELEKRKFMEFIHPEDILSTVETLETLRGQQEVLNFTNRYRVSRRNKKRRRLH